MPKRSNKYAGYQPLDPTGIDAYLGLIRPLDISDHITRFAMLCSVLSGVIVAIWELIQGLSGYDILTQGIGAGLGFLFSFVIAQELDPDRKYGGIIGGVLTFIASLFLGQGNVLAMLWLLFLLRMLNRTSGDRHRIGDNVIIIGTALWLGINGFWLYLMATGAAYALESQLSEGYSRSLYLSGLSLAGAAAVARYIPIIAEHDLSLIYLGIICIAFILFLPEIRLALETKFKGYKDGRRINGRRLQAAQGAFILIMFSMPFLQGDSQALALLPSSMAAIGCGAYLLFCALQKKTK
ncbi:MAG: hypothetical protein LUD24_03245 [Phascolarctobacterium sp.]|nr:hypothetical protein [Phascolarctobacterium sp.]